MSATYVIGDPVTLQWAILSGGVATNATVVLTVTLPDGTTATPTVTNTSTGNYAASITATQNGQHVARWVASGAVVAVDERTFTVGGLCSLTEIKQHLNKTTTADDAELQDHINSVTAIIERHCGAVVPRTVTNEPHSPAGPSLWLRSERVASVTTVEEYLGRTPTTYTAITTPASAGTYTYIRDGVKLTRLGSSGYEQPFTGAVYVTYVAGFAVIPEALCIAARVIVQHLWRTQNGGAGLPSITDEQTVRFDDFESPIPKRAAMVLDAYKRGPMVG